MPDTPPRILFLAAYVQPFLLAGIKMLINKYDAEVLVVCRRPSNYAPSQFFEHPRVRFLFKENNVADIEKSISDFDPGVVWAAGWMDKDYLSWTKQFKKKGKPTIMAMDSQWFGTVRQHINVLLSPFRLKPIYTHVWVPGYAQRIYAKKLGFTRILDSLLTPDTSLFAKAHNDNKEAKTNNYPKSFLYIGELSPQKFETLLNAFTSLSDNELQGWKLIVVGKGAMENNTMMHSPHIDYRGFMQQPELVSVYNEAGVFCLTSTSEAWGVVIQEAAAAGMPLIVSKQCGAYYAMLRDGENGFLCNGESITDIQDKIKKMIALPSSELLKMGEKSHKLGIATNPEMWADTLMSVYKI